MSDKSEAMRKYYERWQQADALKRPHAHSWRENLPQLAAQVRGYVLVDLKEVAGAWDEFGSHELQFILRAPDGHEVRLYIETAALGNEETAPKKSWDDSWGEAQCELGLALQLTLFDEQLELRAMDGETLPSACAKDGTMEVSMPSQEAWFSEEEFDKQIADLAEGVW